MPAEWLLLLAAAERDRRAAEILRAAGADGETIGFHLQQAVEKGLKAALRAHGLAVPRVHDLDALLLAWEGAGWDVAGIEEVAILNDFAVRLRYAAGGEDDDEALRVGEGLAERVRIEVLARVREAGFTPPGELPWPEGVDAKRVGRNDPCPCGSGLKFKECHYKPLREAG